MAEQAISTIYALSENPDVMCADLVKETGTRLFPGAPKPFIYPVGISGSTEASESTVLQVPVSELSRFFFLLGISHLHKLLQVSRPNCTETTRIY